MKRVSHVAVILGTALVLAAPGRASGKIVFSWLYHGQGMYTISLGGTSVQMYAAELRLDAMDGRTIASLDLEFGPVVSPDSPAVFQAGWLSGGKIPVVRLTPTSADADYWLLPPDSSKCYEADSHFLPDVYQGSTLIIPPTETNDGSIYGGKTDDYYAGYGSLWCSVEFPPAARKRMLLVAVIGVRTWNLEEGVVAAYHYRAVDDLGEVTEVWVPEPATAPLLAAGACAVARRRRRRLLAAS